MYFYQKSDRRTTNQENFNQQTNQFEIK